jgi:hypothetical protein
VTTSDSGRRTEYWVHTRSGLVWAVQLVGGEITCAAGPLAPSEADPEILEYLDYSRPDGAWVQQHRHEFLDSRP